MNYKFNFLSVLFIIFFITACDSNDQSSQTNIPESTKAEVKKIIYPFEDLNDPEFYKSERLQFVWQPKGEKTVSVWTIKLDGTDLRRVIEPEKMLYDGASRLNTKRSPNRRYLAYVNYGKDQMGDRNIIDLKTGEIIKLGSEFSGTTFFWGAKGNLLFFYIYSHFHTYNIKTKKITKLKKNINVGGISALSDGKTLVGHFRGGVAYYNYDGEFLKEVKIKDIEKQLGNGKSITSSGSYLLHINLDKYRLYKLGNKPKLIKTHDIPSVINSTIFVMHDDINNVFMAHNWGIMRYELNTDNYYKIYDGDGSRIGNFSILY